MAMESGNSEWTFVGQLASALTLIMKGDRSAEGVGRLLQLVNNRPDFVALLDTPREAGLVTGFPRDLWVPKWEQLYREIYGVTANILPAFQATPEASPEFGWPVFAVPEVGMNRTWGECRNLFPSHSYLGDDLERVVPTNDRRSASGPYLARFRGRVEADEENKSISAKALAERGVKATTLHERLLLEQFVWWMTSGFHLDLVNVTLCAGSRRADGGVPSADWCGGRFQVYCCHPDVACGGFRSRSAV